MIFKTIIATLMIMLLISCNWNLEELTTGTCCDCPRTFIDERDSQVYKTVFIDSSGGNNQSLTGQCWMAENLNFGSFTKDTFKLGIDIFEKHCWQDSSKNCEEFGGYYSWYKATNTNINTNVNSTGQIRGICPKGWHLPSKLDYEQLMKNIKSNPNLLLQQGINETKFFANHIGYRFGSTIIPDPDWKRKVVYFWTSTEFNNEKAVSFLINKEIIPSDVKPIINEKRASFCIRCIKDSN